MTGDQWPTEAGGGGERLPARPDRDPRLPARPRPMQDIVLQGIDDREGDPDEIDLLAYWRILAKHRYLVLATAAGVAALALLYTLMATPIYRATAVIQIEREGIKVLNVEGVTPVDNGYYGDDFLQTQYELLRSRSLAERVAEDLGLPVSLVSAQSSRPSCVRPMLVTRMRGLAASSLRRYATISAWCAVNVPSGWRNAESGGGICAS